MPIVEVVWMDSCVKGGWKLPMGYENENPIEIRSVGYLLKKDATQVVVVQQKGDHGEVADSVHIPRGCVKKIKVLMK